MKPDDKEVTTSMPQVEECIGEHRGGKPNEQLDAFARKTKVSKPFLDSFFVPTSSKKSETAIEKLKEQKPEIIIGKGGQLNLTIHQLRVLDALLRKYSDSDLKVEDNVVRNGFRITRTELLELAGCERTKHKDGKYRFSGREAKRLQQALGQLATTPQLVIIKNLEGNTIFFHEVLVKVAWEMEDTVSPQVVAGSENPAQNDKLNKRLRYYLISLPEFVLDGIESSFRLLPCNLYAEIKTYKQLTLKATRIDVTITEYIFIKWLHRHRIGGEEIRINWFKLAAQLKLDSYIKYRMWANIKQILRGLYELAKGLGYIKDFKIGMASPHTKDKTVDVLYLNPEKIIHVGREKVSRGKK